MPPRKRAAPSTTSTADYRHDQTRLNNPPAGLADVNPLPPAGKKRYSYDPRIDPQLQWAGKAEHLTFDIETVPLYIHERIAPAAIVDSLRSGPVQASMFADPEFDLNQAVEFYQHPQPWANRMVLGDSLLVMNLLLERELMAGKVQCIYFDPPYGINYRSNFQPFTNKRDVKDGDDGSLTREPEQIRAFRDTWELGIHSYLTYIRDRLLLMRELLTESGSIFVQISDENVHRVRAVMDEVFGADNFVRQIIFRTSGSLQSDGLASIADYVLWYAKNINQHKFRELFTEREIGEGTVYTSVELVDGSRRKMTSEERSGSKKLSVGTKIYCTENLVSSGYTRSCIYPFEFESQVYNPTSGKSWKTNLTGMEALVQARRLDASGKTLRYVLYYDDYPVMRLTNVWADMKGESDKIYVVQTHERVIQRCILMTTDPGDLVFDPTCGSGTSAYVAEQWGRRWISCDTSRVALALARQRLLTATFPYYKLAHPEQGVHGAFIYKTVPHITLKSIAQNEPAEVETLYDQPEIDRSTVRVSGPFTVEAVQPPALNPEEPAPPDPLAHAGARGSNGGDAGSYLDRMIEQLRRAGLTVRGTHLPIKRISPLIGGVLHAECDYEQAGKTITAAVVFGPQYGPLTSAQLQDALNEARGSYSALIAAGFAFDAPAQALLGKGTVRPPVLGVAINADLLMDGLLKTSKSSQVFSVFGSPDVALQRGADGYSITVRGIDIYDPNTGDFDASSADQIAAWFLDTDYDGATFLVRQAYFPAQTPNPWEKISKALKGNVDPEQFVALQRTTSLPFKAGKHKQCAVKVIDHRGNEVMAVLRVG